MTVNMNFLWHSSYNFVLFLSIWLKGLSPSKSKGAVWSKEQRVFRKELRPEVIDALLRY